MNGPTSSGQRRIRLVAALMCLAAAACLSADAADQPAAPAREPAPAASHHPSVKLTWKPSPSPRLMGYNIYRSTAPPCPAGPATAKTEARTRNSAPRAAQPPACEPQLLNATPVAKTEYEDRDVERGQTYYYQVRAVAANGGRSAPSNLATAPIPEAR